MAKDWTCSGSQCDITHHIHGELFVTHAEMLHTNLTLYSILHGCHLV